MTTNAHKQMFLGTCPLESSAQQKWRLSGSAEAAHSSLGGKLAVRYILEECLQYVLQIRVFWGSCEVGCFLLYVYTQLR